ncbi:Hypothetical protein NTJ_02577 [Nesidiocoris tenuis]|uniref:Secreted protein n=1 Tax=Nesidiocoris tenuis TaxID=355587 RepID=A0ABN7ABT2_9HEMI|nr:Hypothetical protein NTJ_02577 [Nesidiocoris tenuis]
MSHLLRWKVWVRIADAALAVWRFSWRKCSEGGGVTIDPSYPPFSLALDARFRKEHRVRACSSQPPKAEATGFTGPRSPPMATRPTRRAPETTRPNAVCATARGSAPDSSGDGADDTSAAATTLAPAGTHTGRDADEGPATGGGRSP